MTIMLSASTFFRTLAPALDAESFYSLLPRPGSAPFSRSPLTTCRMGRISRYLNLLNIKKIAGVYIVQNTTARGGGGNGAGEKK